MNTTEIKILLDKYYEGETSRDEEKILKEYFIGDQVDESLLEHLPVFTYFKTESKIKPGLDLEDKILEKLDEVPIIPFYKNKTFWTYFAGIAATLLFLFTFIFETQFNLKTDDQLAVTSYSKQDARLAYDQTRIALAYVSGKYAEATQPLSEVSKFGKSTMVVSELGKMSAELDKINSNVNKMGSSVDKLNKLSKFSIIVKP